jgi:4-hydroxybenzoate polyprenyltransferase
MMGRYGSDQLSMVLLIFSVTLTFIGGLIHLPLLVTISYVPLGICLFRMLSKDIAKRRMENYKFSILISPYL